MSSAITTTTTTKCTPANQCALRTKKPPTSRDLEIYKRVKIQGFQQWEVAQDQQLHYSRVSQVIKRVERWLAAGGDPIDPQIRDYAARQRLALGTCKMRLARGIEIASMALEFNQPVQTTRRRMHGPTEVWREETSREIPKVNLPALRLLVDATQALHQLEQQEESTPTPPPASDRELLRAVFDLLCTWRACAEAQGTLATTPNIPALISESLTNLLGSQTSDLCQRSQRNAQVPLPIAQVPVPTPQAPVPTAQEPLNLSPSPTPSLDANANSPTTSDSPPKKSPPHLSPPHQPEA